MVLSAGTRKTMSSAPGVLLACDRHQRRSPLAPEPTPPMSSLSPTTAKATLVSVRLVTVKVAGARRSSSPSRVGRKRGRTRPTGADGRRGKKGKVMAVRLQGCGWHRPARGAGRTATGSGAVPTHPGETGKGREQARPLGRTGPPPVHSATRRSRRFVSRRTRKIEEGSSTYCGRRSDIMDRLQGLGMGAMRNGLITLGAGLDLAARSCVGVCVQNSQGAGRSLADAALGRQVPDVDGEVVVAGGGQLRPVRGENDGHGPAAVSGLGSGHLRLVVGRGPNLGHALATDSGQEAAVGGRFQPFDLAWAGPPRL